MIPPAPLPVPSDPEALSQHLLQERGSLEQGLQQCAGLRGFQASVLMPKEPELSFMGAAGGHPTGRSRHPGRAEHIGCTQGQKGARGWGKLGQGLGGMSGMGN